MTRRIIGIIGGHASNAAPQALGQAFEAGRILGEMGLAIVCGGYDGIMEAACRGCKEAGGTTLAVLKESDSRKANGFIDYAVQTAMDIASNHIIVRTAAGILGFDGRYGTLAEIGISLDVGRPLVLLGDRTLADLSRIRDHPWFAHYPGYDRTSIRPAIEHLLRMVDRQVEIGEC